MIDPIADMLTRIRNAYMAKKAEVLVPHSKIKFAIAQILAKEKYILNVEEVTENKVRYIKIGLLYNKKESAISNIKRVSSVGKRVYVNREEIPVVLNNYGIAIISTSKGIMTNKEAKKQGVGGELLCEVY